jgi:integrase
MPGTTNDVNITSPAARARLKKKSEPHWRTLIVGRAAIGWQKGRWLLRQFIDAKYSRTFLGRADDGSAEADGDLILSFDQAEAKARAMLDAPTATPHRLTVRAAMFKYVERLRHEGKDVSDLIYRLEAWINPLLGNAVVADVTPERLRKWLATVAASPAMKRTKQGKQQQYRDLPKTEEEIRARRSSANRVLNMLRAGLNNAYDERWVSSNVAWNRRLKPFTKVDSARPDFLTIAECQRLINSADPEFKPLIQAALQSGCRYGELCRLEVRDFHPDSGTLHVRHSKNDEPRTVFLTEEGVAFFVGYTAGRPRTGLMFARDSGKAWTKSAQVRPMKKACERAKIDIGFHQLRHTYTTHTAKKVPLWVLARNFGHKDTRMIEKHYGHLAPSYIAEQIRAGAPRFNVVDRKITPLR